MSWTPPTPWDDAIAQVEASFDLADLLEAGREITGHTHEETLAMVAAVADWPEPLKSSLFRVVADFRHPTT